MPEYTLSGSTSSATYTRRWLVQVMARMAALGSVSACTGKKELLSPEKCADLLKTLGGEGASIRETAFQLVRQAQSWVVNAVTSTFPRNPENYSEYYAERARTARGQVETLKESLDGKTKNHDRLMEDYQNGGCPEEDCPDQVAGLMKKAQAVLSWAKKFQDALDEPANALNRTPPGGRGSILRSFSTALRSYVTAALDDLRQQCTETPTREQLAEISVNARLIETHLASAVVKGSRADLQAVLDHWSDLNYKPPAPDLEVEYQIQNYERDLIRVPGGVLEEPAQQQQKRRKPGM
ncbi:MAG: hypothetical protein M3O22_04525 [Pseudomonadota bacterium]|nr:hypothetical protein [Pseudomonadota bacterium]